MGKSSHFLGQPIYSQLLSLLDRRQIMRLSQEHAGERYTKRFDAWTHLVVMLYAVIKRFDSLREIAVSLLAEAPKLQHLDLSTMGYRSTLSDANKRRPELFPQPFTAMSMPSTTTNFPRTAESNLSG